MSAIVPASSRRIPIALKLVLTAFVIVQVVFYWSAYGPTNFLYFCDVALFLTLISVVWEKALPASMAAVGILLPQFLWAIDFFGGVFGHPFVGMTAYMFQDNQPLYARAISLFHGWLPFLLLYVVYRLGYDRRALPAWTLLAWGLMLIAYFLLPAPPAPESNKNLPVNVNYVYGVSDEKAQEWMPPLAWLAVMMTGLPILFFIPTHLLLLSRMKPNGDEKKRRSAIPIPVAVDPAVNDVNLRSVQ
jgi:predicted small integral membrane protein